MNLTERKKRRDELKNEVKNNLNSSQTSTTGGTYSSSRAKKRAAMKQEVQQGRISAVSSELTTRIDTWFKNNENYINNYTNRFSGVTGSHTDPYDSDISNWISTVTTQKSNFDTEAASIKSIIEENKDYLNSDWVNEVFSAFDSASKVQSDIINASNSFGEYWSQWESADAYNEWAGDVAERERLLGINLDESRSEIERLQSYADMYDEATSSIPALKTLIQQKERELKYGHFVDTDKVTKELNDAKMQLSRYENTLSQLGNLDINKLKGDISQKSANLTLAERAQKAAELASVADVNSKLYDPNFDAYSELGQHISYESVGGTKKQNGIVVYDDLKAATLALNEHRLGTELFTEDMLIPGKGISGYIQGLKGISEYNTENIKVVDTFRKMKENEFAILAYYLKKDEENGTDLAAQYVESIKETLNTRIAVDIAEAKKDNLALQYVFAAEAGLDQFYQGRDAWFAGEDYIVPSATQIASGMIREDLAETGKQIEWLGGVSLGQLGYDAINTSANMLPSILASTAVNIAVPGAGAYVGTGLLGMSAGGNARAEMLNLGYSKEQATSYGLMVGVAEASMEYVLGHIPGLSSGDGIFSTLGTKVASKVDNAISRVAITLGDKGVEILQMVAGKAIGAVGGALDEALEEGLQTIIEPWLKEAATSVDWDAANVDEVLYSSLLGAITSFGFSAGETVIDGVSYPARQNAEAKKTYGAAQSELAAEAVALNPNSKFAQKMQTKVESGKDLSGAQLNRLVKQNNTTMTKNDSAAIKNAAISRLTELGESGDVDVIASALTKQVTGKALSIAERTALKESSFGQQVANELKPGSPAEWAQKIGTDRINADEYSRMVAEIENEGATVSKMEQVQNEADSLQVTGKLPASKADITTDTDHIADEGKMVEAAEVTEPTVASEAAVREVEAENATNETPEVNEASEGKVEASEADNSVTLEEASKAYGAQAGAMIHTYAEGQDVGTYDAAYRAAYDMGKSGVGLSYAMQSEATAYLTEKQRELAHAAGVDASRAAAKDLDAKNKAAANGKTGRRKGTVKGEGVTISDLKASLNDTQGRAYKILSTVAEVTGIDIVLYKSEANADGMFEGAQGRFKWSEDTIYIDINAGLANIKGVNDLAKYTMVRTFSHEFSHFLEKWNPIWYNELRKVVFDTITENGENVDSLIAIKMEQTGLDYDQASREVVAEALTDILPDANFVETLASKHRNVFEQLLAKLKEFLADLKAYFSSIGPNSAREANALKEQIGDGVKYFENVVALFDRVAVEAVESYQMTVATEEVAEKAEKIESTDTISSEENAALPASEAVEETATPETEATEEAAKVEAPAKTEAAPAEADTRSIEEIEKEYKRKFSSWLKRSVRQYVFNYGGATFLSNGAFGLRASKEIVNLARSEFVGQITETDIPDAAVRALENSTLITEAPLEGTQGDIYIFNINGKKQAYDKKMLSKLDGNLFYIGDFVKGAMMIKAVDTDGNMVGFLMPIKLGSEVTDTKPSKLKSFSNKFLSQISNQEVKANGEEAGTVLPHRSDGQGDSRLLAESQTEDVPGDGAERNAVDDSRERGNEAGRDDSRPDAEGSRGRSGEGDRESGDLRRDDGLTPEAEKLHEEVAEQIAEQSTEQPRGRNFVIGDSLDLPSGEKARYKANIEAIRLVKQLEAEGRYATEAEQTVLSKYVGWGGLANAFDQRKSEWAKEYTELKELLTKEEYELARGSTLNAHYTDISVIKAMYDGLAGLGFNGGRLLEPSSGVGNFVGAMPEAMSAKVKSFTMVELDGITGLIAKYLYPNADVRIQGFEKAIIPDNYMDVAISNVPFGNYPITDKAYPKKVTSAIHNYFFAKSLDKVRPGGIVMFITSSYTMNAKDSTVRRYIMQKADLLGAIRLPDSAFKGNAGTEVVTDIIVLKKRADNTPYAGEDFLEAPYKNISGYNGAYINSYFDAHPEMVLGTATMDGGMYRSNTLTYKALEGKGSLGDQIREAFKSIKGKMEYPAAPSREKTNFAVERAGKKTKENGLVVKDGKVYQNKGGELVEVQTAKGAAERISGMLDIRDAARELMTYQQQGLNDTEIKKARTKLNRAYDEFVKKYGYINSQANKTAIKDDPDKFSIFALENYDSEKKTATKADIFSKNTIAPNRTVTSAKDVSEGLIVSINQTGGVDAALIARLTGKTEADVTRELIDSRKAFKTRSGGLEAAETYLSGNVRAKLRDAEALSMLDADYKNNVEALKSVMPEDVGYQDIFVNAGTPWIPNSVYSDFAAYMLGGRNTEWRQDVDITRNPETGNFTVELKNRYLKTNAANTQKWGTARRSFLELFDAMLNSKSVVIKDKLEDGSSVINRDATAAANEKIENIQKEFTDWLWRDEGRRGELATLYNEIFNSIVTPKYNGDNLTVNGANAMKPLRPHQRDAVQRVISSGGNTLLAHKVGAGKTYEMAAAAMKLKELGLVKKPMFAVPKSLVAQWGNEFKDFFPTAKLLVAEASDFTAANRKVFMNRIANGEYDAVIVSYEQFEKLPMSDDFTRNLYQEQIDSVVAAIEEAKAEKGAKSLSIKDLEKKRKSLQAKIDKLTDKAKDEDNIDFEGLGVDSLFVDEAHNFKNLFYTTAMTNVSGLGNRDGSKRAFDLYTKVRWLQQLNGGRGIVFATATPVMNSMSEMYIMQKYLQPDLINQLGLSTFDAWAKQFGEVVNGVEIKPSGQGYRVKQSFSRFKNMSELQLLFRNFADVLTDIPGLKIPKMKGGRVNVVVCEPGQFQQDYMEELAERAENVKNVDPSVDNMLKITSDGRKISYTQRMIDPSLPYEEGCKIYRCADNVVKAYNESRENKGTQLIFCDMATPKGKSNTNENATEDIETDTESAQLYDDIKARLIKNGIPAKEIAFIHEADTDAKKKKLFADVNDGKVRVLIGSTGKMGVGMNAQKRVVAIHHLDAPWRPGDVEQRNGRAFRQGNINDEVECFTYVTEGSFDARLWDILERKQNFINQIMNGESVGREAEDTGEVTLSAAEVKALASGSPLILEQVQLDTDIKKLESLYRAHLSAIRSAKARLLQDEGTVVTLEKYIEAGKADISARVDTYSEGKFSIKVGKTTFTDKKDAGAALMAAAIANAATEGYTTIGSFAGFDIRVIKTSEGIKGLLSGKQGYSFNTYPERPTYMITHLSGVAESIDEKVKLWQHNLEEVRNDIAEQEKLIAEPFGKQAELDAKRARYTEVMDILNPKEEQALDSVAEDTVQEQSRAYLGERDSDGNTLTQSQAEYFKDSKARDESGNLLVLYHGTANAGFTVFDPSRGKFGGSWFTTSRKDADSYGGNYSHKLFDPSETDDIRTSAGGNYTLGSWMRFDTEADRAEFLRKYPNAENIKTDAEYDALLQEAEKARDWDEYDRIEEEQAENRKELKKLERAYGIYEWEHSREATVGELLGNPERFTVNDVLRAWDAYDSNNAARDEDYTKEELIEGLRAENERMIGDGDGSLEDLTFKARIPFGEVGQIVNRANNRTYAVYANVTKPYIINARQHTLAGANLYPAIEAGMSAAEYDGVIVRNARVGAHQETGDVVIIKESGQVKLTSNKTPTPSSDISYQQRTDTLTDREVLQVAAEDINTEKWTEAERGALDIFKKRLANLEALQTERTEQGRLYKEQQFGAKVDRAAAAETLNRMHILDDKIKAANAEVLALENKEILGRVLKKARKVVETEQRAHDDEIFKRYVDRAKNAAAIKKYRDRIKADVDTLKGWITKPDHKDIYKHVPDVVKTPVIEFLASIDFTSKQQLKGKEATKADKEFAKSLANLHKVLLKQTTAYGENYSDYIDLPPGYVERMEAYIEDVNELVEKNSGEFVINKMTSEELRELSHIVKTLKLYVTQMNSFHNNAMYRHVYEAGNDLITELAPKASDKGKTGKARNFAEWQNIRPSYVWERFGRAGIAIRDELQAGQSKYGFNAREIVNFTEKTFKSEEVRSYREKLHTFTIGGEKVTMRVSHIMGLYLLSKQEDSLRHILKGGIRVGNFQQRGLSKKIYSSDSHILTQTDIDLIVGKLTARQKAVADALQKFMAEKGAEWGNEVSFKRFGEALFGELNYYPIAVDKLQVGQKEEFPEGASLYALLNKSFTKARNKEAANRIMLYDVFDVFANHMSSMAQYNALAIPVLDATKWLNYQQKNSKGELIDSVKDELTRVFGAPVGSDKGHAVTFIENILKDINGTSAQGSPYDNLYLKFLHNYNISKVSGNLKSALLQPTAIIRAANVIDAKSILSALNPADIKTNTEEMLKYSGIAVWKDLGFYDVNISRGMHDLIANDTTGLQRLTEKSLWLAETLDRVTWSAMWGAAKQEVRRKYKLTPKDTGFYELVTKTFEEIIYKTQVVDSVLTKSELMRNKGAVARTVSSFMSEPVTSLSMLIDVNEKVRREGWAKHKEEFFKAYATYTLQALFVALAGAMPYMWRDDDEYEEWYEKFLAAAKSNFFSELDPFSKMPFVAEAWESLLTIFKTVHNAAVGTNWQIYSQNTAVADIVADLAKGAERLIDKLTNENTKYTHWTWIYALIEGGSAILGAPFASYAKEATGIWNNTVGVLYPDLKFKTYDAGARNEIKYAYLDKHLTEEEATQHLLEKGIVKNKYEAFFEIEGWKYGMGYSKFGAYYDAILAEDEEKVKLYYDNLYGEKISEGNLRLDAIDSIHSSLKNQVKDAYIDGEIDKETVYNVLVPYADMSEDDIETELEKWEFEIEHGFSWGERAKGYRRGEITETELKTAVMEIEDEELSDADAYIRLLNLEMANQDLDITADIASKYFEFAEPAGIDLDVFIDFKDSIKGIEGDKDKHGNTISGSKKAKIMDVINSLPLTKAQKDALYYASGYEKSTIREAPWR